MSNTEETPESSRKRSSLVDDFLESGRKKARTSLSTDDNHIEDLEYILKSVKALVKIINEKWDNCDEHLTSNENCETPLSFERVLFKEAKVEKKGRNLIISTQKVSDAKDFGSLPAVPEDLSNLVCFGPPESESDILPDYNRYLEKSSILCEDVLLPFLTSFQEHLKEIQVFLGKIEEWLLEPEVAGSFLEKTFDGPGCRTTDKNNPLKIILYGSYCLDVNSKTKSTYDLCTEDGREGLKAAFVFVKTFKPVIQIEVKDAGEKAVNGTYTLAGK